MKRALLYSVIAVFAVYLPHDVGQHYSERDALKSEASHSSHARFENGIPDLGELKLISQFPDPLPPRVSGFAYDGKKLWAVVYQGHGVYATFDPVAHTWKIADQIELPNAIREVSGAFGSPGGICFVDGRLWVAGSYGESFGSINLQDRKVEHIFKGKQRDDPQASQSYWGMAYDGNHLWIAWHWFKYKLSESQTQLLLKVEPETGKVVGEFPLPAGTRNDGTHGLTWDGTRLWHMKDSRLSAIDPSTGRVIAQYSLDQIKRPSGLAWDGESLWIIEFDGKVWRLPFEDVPAT
jgi:hypothetical protein